MKTKNLKDKLVECIDEMDMTNLITMWNDFCPDGEEVYEMEDFDDTLLGYDSHEIAFKIHDGDFDPSDDYFILNDMDNLESSSDICDFIDTEYLADLIIDNYAVKEVVDDYHLDLEY